MAIIKLVKEQYPNKGDVYKLAYYLGRYNKCPNEIAGGNNIMCTLAENPDFVADQFVTIQHGQRFTRRLYHVVVSFEEGLDDANNRFAFNVGKCICNLYPDYQSAFIIHQDTNFIHIHVIFNNCPIYAEKPKLTCLFNRLTIQNLVENMIFNHLGIVVNEKG